MENTPREPNEPRVSMCSITSSTPRCAAHRKRVKFPELKFGSTSSAGYELSHTRWMEHVILKQIIKARNVKVGKRKSKRGEAKRRVANL